MVIRKLEYGPQPPIHPDAKADPRVIEAILKKRRVIVIKKAGEVSCKRFRIIDEKEQSSP